MLRMMHHSLSLSYQTWHSVVQETKRLRASKKIFNGFCLFSWLLTYCSTTTTTTPTFFSLSLSLSLSLFPCRDHAATLPCTHVEKITDDIVLVLVWLLDTSASSKINAVSRSRESERYPHHLHDATIVSLVAHVAGQIAIDGKDMGIVLVLEIGIFCLTHALFFFFYWCDRKKPFPWSIWKCWIFFFFFIFSGDGQGDERQRGGEKESTAPFVFFKNDARKASSGSSNVASSYSVTARNGKQEKKSCSKVASYEAAWSVVTLASRFGRERSVEKNWNESDSKVATKIVASIDGKLDKKDRGEKKFARKNETDLRTMEGEKFDDWYVFFFFFFIYIFDLFWPRVWENIYFFFFLNSSGFRTWQEKVVEMMRKEERERMEDEARSMEEKEKRNMLRRVLRRMVSTQLHSSLNQWLSIVQNIKKQELLLGRARKRLIKRYF